uniref:DUF4216 domain-containing protein n=1 Tax=Ananas comosus var. bracteatus TaxID=296719 RepID=A0A6V7QCB6_ANACO|nr:unnamed protein product [Ananas comosus var. bracteatus]
MLTLEEWDLARLFVLRNCNEVNLFLKEFEDEIIKTGVKNVKAKLDKDFAEWFENRIGEMHRRGIGQVGNQLLSLAHGPMQEVKCYAGYIVNGFRFQTKDHELQKKSQNSGVVVKGESANGACDFYGILTDIVELCYMGDHQVVLFKCDWWDVDTPNRGIKTDEYGFIMLNFSRTLRYGKSDPFVLACHSEQVYYVRDIRRSNWHTVIRAEPRDFYNTPREEMNDKENEEDLILANEPFQQIQSSSYYDNSNTMHEAIDEMNDMMWKRNDLQGLTIDLNEYLKYKRVDKNYASNSNFERDEDDQINRDDDDDDDDDDDVGGSDDDDENDMSIELED